MSNLAIKVESLGKQYRIGERERYLALRDVLTRLWQAPFRRLWTSENGSRGEPEHAESAASPVPRFTRSQENDIIWALKDVSFSVNHGEVVGIIGRNGAGKSTLLKILSRITKPTEGYADIHGRVGSLLEVGTGFHPELTGRENIYLNGAILGMKKAEIVRKFDEIVAFAEVEKFIDTPVKHYSSGMYVRLAFAVAAHLEPEILLVDEVLAVGDAAFQKKCLGKMGDVAKEGRTVLFVSHNMAAVKALCTCGILLSEGKIAMNGDTHSLVANYLQSSLTQASEQEWPDLRKAPGNDNVKLNYVRVRPPEGETILTIDTGSVVEIGFFNFRETTNLDCTVYVVSSEGVVLFETGCIVSSNNDSKAGQYRLVGTIPPHLLNAGRYYLNIVFGKDQRYVLFKITEVVAFDVANTNTGRGRNMSVAPGLIRPLLQWQCSFTQGVVQVAEDKDSCNSSRL